MSNSTSLSATKLPEIKAQFIVALVDNGIDQAKAEEKAKALGTYCEKEDLLNAELLLDSVSSNEEKFAAAAGLNSGNVKTLKKYLLSLVPSAQPAPAPSAQPAPAPSAPPAQQQQISVNLASLTPVQNMHSADELIDVMLDPARPTTDRTKARNKLEGMDIQVAYQNSRKEISWTGTREYREWLQRPGATQMNEGEEFEASDSVTYIILSMDTASNLNQSTDPFTGKLLRPGNKDANGVPVPVGNLPAMQFVAWLIVNNCTAVLPRRVNGAYNAKEVAEFYRDAQGAVGGNAVAPYDTLFRRYQLDLELQPAVGVLSVVILRYRTKKGDALLRNIIMALQQRLDGGRRSDRDNDTPNSGYDRSERNNDFAAPRRS